MSEWFVTTYQLPHPEGWYVTADQEGRLLQPAWGVTTYDPQDDPADVNQAAGIASVTIKNSTGKVVFDVDQRGLLGERNRDGNAAAVGLLISPDTTDYAPPVGPVFHGTRLRSVWISPATFAAGGQIIISFAGKVPEQTTELRFNATLWQDGFPPNNLPSGIGSLGQISFDESSPNGGGQAKITIDFTLIEE
jgi:hypothetical protein